MEPGYKLHSETNLITITTIINEQLKNKIGEGNFSIIYYPNYTTDYSNLTVTRAKYTLQPKLIKPV